MALDSLSFLRRSAAFTMPPKTFTSLTTWRSILRHAWINRVTDEILRIQESLATPEQTHAKGAF